MSCEGYPTASNMKLLATDAQTINEVVTSTADLTTPASDGLQKTTLAGIDNKVADAISNSFSAYIGEWSVGLTFNAPNEYAVFNGVSYKPKRGTTLPYVAQGADPTLSPDVESVEPFSDINTGNIYANAGGKVNNISNPQCKIASPDLLVVPPSATPTDYVPGEQVYSGAFADETVGITGLTDAAGLKNATSGKLYFLVPNTGALESLNDFTASYAGLDLKPKTDGVTFSLDGSNYKIEVDFSVATDVFSVKFETGSIATGHEVQKSPTVLNIVDFGGATNGALNDSAIAQAISLLSPSGGEIVFPDIGDSIYNLSSKPVGGGAGFVFRFLGAAKIEPVSNYPDGASYLGFNQQGTETSYKAVRVTNDGVDQPSINGSKVNANKNVLGFGGAGTRGGRHVGYDVLLHQSPTAADNPDRNYVATVGLALGTSTGGDGGTDLVAGKKGALFACNFVVLAQDGYINTLNITGGEFNSGMAPGASTSYHSVAQLVTQDETQGSDVDCGLAIGAKPFAVGLRHGILLTTANGGFPIDSVNGTLIGAQTLAGQHVMNYGIDLSLCDFTTAFIKSKPFTVSGSGDIEVGSTSAQGLRVRTIDFHCSGAKNDYDARLQVSGGSATTGDAVMSAFSRVFTFNSNIRSDVDAVKDVGAAAFRWNDGFFVNTPIGSSDRNLKTEESLIPDLVLDAWSNVPKKRYKWIDSVQEKGDSARWHVGVIAQDVIQEFSNLGLDACEYGVICFDEWDEQVIDHQEALKPELDTNGNVVDIPDLDESGNQIQSNEVVPVLDDDGKPTGDTRVAVKMHFKPKMIVDKEAWTEIIPAGKRYGIRYGQAAQLDAALERRERKKLEDKINTLMGL